MSILDSLKAVFGASGVPTAFCDNDLRVLWKNSSEVPDSIIPDDLRVGAEGALILPVEKECFCRFRTGSAALVTPVSEDGKPAGYLIRFYSSESIELLMTHSDKLTEQQAMLGSIRFSLQSAVTRIEELRHEDPVSATELTDALKLDLMRALSGTVNYGEAAKIYSGSARDEEVELASQIRLTLEQFGSIFESGALKITSRLTPGVCVRINYNQLEAVLLNLIVNSFQYNGSENKETAISLTSKDGEAVLTVSDNGTSADLEAIERLSHYCGRKSSGGGEQLALAMSRRLIEEHGGSLSFENTESGGLRVIIKLPLLRSDDGILNFRASPAGKLYMPYDPAYCILAKGFDVFGGKDRK